VGGTTYPGLLFTASTAYHALRALGLPFDIRDVCVMVGPVVSGLSVYVAYLFGKEVRGTPQAGLCSALFLATVPSFISRSVAGSYDCEAVAIGALVLTFYLYLRTLNTGSLLCAAALTLSYWYMVLSWGGYNFVINLISIHAFGMLVLGRYSARLYVAFAPFAMMGTLAALSVPVVGFNAVTTSEHFSSFLMFAALNAAAALEFLRAHLSASAFATAQRLTLTGAGAGIALGIAAMVAYVAASPTKGWTGRSLSLLDPTYASKYIPIIASVSEHQPTTWSHYFDDLNVPFFLMPLGLVVCFRPLTDASLFLAIYGVVALYFSGVMIRLNLVLAPAACLLGGIAAAELLDVFSQAVVDAESAAGSNGDRGEAQPKGAPGGAATPPAEGGAAKKGRRARGGGGAPGVGGLPAEVGFWGIGMVMVALCCFVFHSTDRAEMYSSPSIVLQGPKGYMFDDYRETFQWINRNTPEDAKVASWWDYGYQTTAMANRTVLVDNNTWNNTHIATVGKAMASPEKTAWQIYKDHDVTHVLVVFGGQIGYSSDDINKFLWMIRIGGGVFPEIREKDYLSGGTLSVSAQAAPALKNSLMYKLSYHNFAENAKGTTGQWGYDRVRQVQIAYDPKLEYFEEAFTSKHWMLRLYRLKDVPPNEI